MKLYCKKCNNILTPNSLIKSKIDELNYNEEKEFLSLEKYIEVKNTNLNFNVSIDCLINSKSINLKNHKDKLKFKGCCGPSDFGCLNQVCEKCGFDIGVLIADCWTPVFIGIDLSKVSLKPLW